MPQLLFLFHQTHSVIVNSPPDTASAWRRGAGNRTNMADDDGGRVSSVALSTNYSNTMNRLEATHHPASLKPFTFIHLLIVPVLDIRNGLFSLQMWSLESYSYNTCVHHMVMNRWREMVTMVIYISQILVELLGRRNLGEISDSFKVRCSGRLPVQRFML